MQLEEAFELRLDDAFDVSVDVGEGALNVQAFGWPLIPKRYVRGRLKIHLHLRLIEPEVADDCVILKRFEEPNIRPFDNACIQNERAGRALLTPTISNARIDSAHHAQTLVPVYASEFIEDKKPIFVRVPSLVWLQLLNSCPDTNVRDLSDLMHPTSGAVGAGFLGNLEEGGFGAVDGEAGRARWLAPFTFEGETPSEMFECGTHVLKSIPGDDAEKRWRLLSHLSAEDMLAAVCVMLVGNSLRLSSVEGGKLLLENLQMLTRSDKFESSTRKRSGHSALHLK